MKIYVDISGAYPPTGTSEQSNAANSLSRLWRDRDRYIPAIGCLYSAPVPDNSDETQQRTREFAVKRLGDHTYQFLSDIEPHKKNAALDSVRIKPGKLFLSAQKTLCYYHEVAVPGSVFDESQRDGITAECDALKKKIEGELDRRKAGGRTVSWDRLKSDLLDYWDSWPAAELRIDAPSKSVTDPITCLEESSLKLLLAAAQAGQSFYSRKGGDFQCSVSLSSHDCRQAKAVFEAFQKQLANPGLTTSPAKPDAAESKSSIDIQLGISLAAMAKTLRATIADDKRFVVTLSVPGFIDLTPETIRGGKPLPRKAAEYQTAIREMKAIGAPIDEKLTIEDVIREFSTPSLKKADP